MVALLGAVVLVVGLYASADVLPIFVVGLILSFLIDTPTTVLAQRGVPRSIATVLMIALVLAGVAVLLTLVLSAAVRQGGAFIAAIPDSLAALRTWYVAVPADSAIRGVLDAILNDLAAALTSFNLAAAIAAIVRGIFGLVGSLAGFLVLPFFMFFVVRDRPRIAGSVEAALPARWREDVFTVIELVVGRLGAYVRSEATLMAVVGVATWVGLLALGFFVDARFHEYALFLAVLAGIGELIPMIGPWLAALPALLLSATMGPPAIVAVIVLYVAIGFIESNVLVPAIQGRAFAVHPAVVMFAVTGGLVMVGPPGAILALPVVAGGWDIFRYAFRRSLGLTPTAAARS
jgi:predicted PurR-regulated permease PerM